MPALLLFLLCLGFSVWFVFKYDDTKGSVLSNVFTVALLSILIFSIVGGIFGLMYGIAKLFNSIFV